MELPTQNFDSQMGDVGTQAAQQLGKGADEVYARLREDDKRDVLEKHEVKPEDVVGSAQNFFPPPLIQPQNNADLSLGSKNNGAIGAAGTVGTGTATAEAFSQSTDSTPEGTARMVLDSWGDAIAKYVESSKQHNAAESQLHNQQVAQRWVQDVFQLGTTQVPHSTVISAIMMAGMTGVMAGNKVDPTDPQHLAFSFNQETLQAFTPMVPSDLRAELGLLGAMMMTQAGYQATAMTIGKADTAEQPINQEMARNYGLLVVKLINDKGFNGLLETIVQARAPGEGKLTNAQVGEWMANLKLGMLMSAYALSYKAAFGGVTGIEVRGDVAQLDLAKAGGDAALLDAIRSQLATMSPEQQAAALNRITDWLNRPETTRKASNLMDPLKVFQGLTSQGGVITAKAITETPG